MNRLLSFIRTIAPHLLICLGIFVVFEAFAAGTIGVAEDSGLNPVKNNSIFQISGGDAISTIRKLFVDIIDSVRIIFIGLAVLAMAYIAYIWMNSQGDEEAYTEGKYRILLITIGLFAMYVAELLYTIITGSSYVEEGFRRKVTTISTFDPGGSFTEPVLMQCNFFFCPQNFFGNGAVVGVVKFFEVIMIVTAVIMFTWGGVRLFMRGGSEDHVAIAKRRITHGVIAIVCVGFVESIYRAIFFGGSLNMMSLKILGVITMVANFFVFMAGPLAIILMIIGAYYYIMSGGDEEKADRGKRIILYTFFATILLLLSYTFVIELAKFITF